jgi:hypothetical protein
MERLEDERLLAKYKTMLNVPWIDRDQQQSFFPTLNHSLHFPASLTWCELEPFTCFLLIL